MKKILFVLGALIFTVSCFAQSVSQRLIKAFSQFESDSQLKAAISSLYVIDSKTDKLVFEKNAATGLAPASTQKLITSASAYELLGTSFRYKTEFGVVDKSTSSPLYVFASGDPTFGSWRWEQTKEVVTLKRIAKALNQSGVAVENVILKKGGWDFEAVPDGWIWQDIGNYYGAGAHALNWRENQFDILLKSGKNIGDKVEIVKTEPQLVAYKTSSVATAAAKGSGDNAYVYFPLVGEDGLVRGTIPVNETAFRISAAMPFPKLEFAALLAEELKTSKTLVSIEDNTRTNIKIVHTEVSPSLDAIIYWLNKKSINLYAEALVKTIAFQKQGEASTEKGVDLIKNFWNERGIDVRELNIVDGSGLSPLNRVTTKAQVQVLKYAKKQQWFSGFFESLPEYNGMKIKSGTINKVKAFAGYHTSPTGDYIFSFIVNNYNGSSTTLVQKMYKVLDALK